MTVVQAVLAMSVAALGCAVQGSIGFGLGLLAAPLLLLIEPRLVPGPLLLTSLVLTLLLTRREWHAVRWRDLAWSLPGRLAGTLAALLVLRSISADRLSLLLGGLILAGVLITASGLRLPLRPATLLGAGTVAGFTSTTTSMGGPPIALVYQHENGPAIRGTLSAFFVVGVVISLAGLTAIGHFGATELRLTAVLLPGVPAGYWASRHGARLADAGWMRPAILVASALAGAGVVFKELL